MNPKDATDTRHPFNAATRAELYQRANGTDTIREGDEIPRVASSALDTVDETATLRFIAVQWFKGYFGQRHNGEGTVTSGGKGWRFKGSFLSSGRTEEYEAENLTELRDILRAKGWLPDGSGMIGG